MTRNGDDGFLALLLSSRRAWLTYLGALVGPIELVRAVARGNGLLAAIFGCLAVAMWIEVAAARGLRTERIRWIEYGAILGLVVLYLVYALFYWREFLLDGF